MMQAWVTALSIARRQSPGSSTPWQDIVLEANAGEDHPDKTVKLAAAELRGMSHFDEHIRSCRVTPCEAPFHPFLVSLQGVDVLDRSFQDESMYALSEIS